MSLAHDILQPIQLIQPRKASIEIIPYPNILSYDEEKGQDISIGKIDDEIQVEDLKLIWSGLEGDIVIILPTIIPRKNKVASKNSEYNEEGRKIIFDALKKFTVNGPLVFAGDMYVRDAVLRILLSLYPNERIITCFEQHIVTELEELSRNSNAIIIGGPESSDATDFIMKKLNIRSLFSGYSLTSLENPDVLKYKPSFNEQEQRTYEDYGVIVKALNPIAEKKRYVFIFAGCRSFGTRAAGAVLAMAKSANEIVKYYKSKNESLDSFKLLVKTFRDEGKNPLDTDIENELRIIEPFIGKIHHNYEELIATDYALQMSVLNSNRILSQSSQSLPLNISILKDITKIGQVDEKEKQDTTTEHNRNEVLRQAIEHFKEFENSLNKPEAAMYIHLAKKKLEESWNYITDKDRVIGLMLSAVEDSIRQQKWRDYKSYQVEIIRDILQDCVDGKIKNQKDVLERTSKLYKHDIDIFPSATEEAYDEDE